MVEDEHPVFGHALEGLPIQIVKEGEGVLLSTSNHPYSEESGVEVVHVCDQRLPLVKGAPTYNDFLGSLGTKSHCNDPHQIIQVCNTFDRV